MKIPKLKLSKQYARLSRWAVFAGVVLVLGGSSVALALTLPHAPSSQMADNGKGGIHAEYAALARDAQALQNNQRQAGVQVVGQQEVEQLLNRVRTDIDLGQVRQARADMRMARATLAGWQQEITSRAVGVAPVAVSGQISGSLLLPIVLYHYTPPDFDAQLTHLERTGYTVIDMDQALAGLHGAALPAKPVVITFDDGFSDQLRAFEVLQRHNMKATFYIINGGEASRWCIGAGRRYNDPGQPPGGCGDAYLNWDQVRALDRSGLITIGGHTLDHENLATLPPAEQRHQIIDSTSIDLAREAGYLTAVTTLPGDYQPAGSDFVLRRARDTLSLP
jgi:hypothetical protein